MRAFGFGLVAMSAVLSALGILTADDTSITYWLFACCCGGVGARGIFNMKNEGGK